jgi:ferredoxin
MLKVGHVVVRPGRKAGEGPVEIPVPEELETVPGIPMVSKDIDFYSREYPLQRQQVEHAADVEWAPTVGTEAMKAYKVQHDAVMDEFYPLMNRTGDLEPTGMASGADVTDLIRDQARSMGFLDVGFTSHDMRFVFQDRKEHVKYPNAVCLALEQDFEETQTAPSMAAEHGHYGTYETQAPMGLRMVDYILSLGYHAQLHGPSNHSAATIPMFVAAGMGQLGANGQLLTPHAGARCRLQIITTDAPVSFDAPVDYGFHAFCQVCQVCVNRCPGRALMREKIWWRGVEKNKLVYKRCRPVMSRYEGCAICMKVCPINKYGGKAVMEHYVQTGQVLGKGTHDLEGYTLHDESTGKYATGYFGPGELPTFDASFFKIPTGTREAATLDEFIDYLKEHKGELEGADSEKALFDFRDRMREIVAGESVSDSTMF